MTKNEYKAAIVSAVNEAIGAIGKVRLAIVDAVNGGCTKKEIAKWLLDAGWNARTVRRRIAEAFNTERKERKDKGKVKAETLELADALLGEVFASEEPEPAGGEGDDKGGEGAAKKKKASGKTHKDSE